LNANQQRHLCFLILAVFFLFHAAAFAGDAEMEKAFKLLTTARGLVKYQVTPESDPLPILEAARDALKKAPNNYKRYHGHRGEAVEAVQKAIDELKTGDRDHKAIEYIDHSIAEIHAGGGLSR